VGFIYGRTRKRKKRCQNIILSHFSHFNLKIWVFIIVKSSETVPEDLREDCFYDPIY